MKECKKQSTGYSDINKINQKEKWSHFQRGQVEWLWIPCAMWGEFWDVWSRNQPVWEFSVKYMASHYRPEEQKGANSVVVLVDSV